MKLSIIALMVLAGLGFGCERSVITSSPVALAQEGEAAAVQEMVSPKIEAEVKATGSAEAKAEEPEAAPPSDPESAAEVPEAEVPRAEPTAPTTQEQPAPTPEPVVPEVPSAVSPTPPAPAPSEPTLAPAEIATKPLLPSPPTAPPVTESEHHRRLFNRVAAELYPLRWITDRENPHRIDILQEELSVPDAMRESFQLPRVGWAESEALTTAVKVIGAELEERRQAALQAVDQAQRGAVLRFSLAQFSDATRQVAEQLLEIAPDVQVLYQLQMDRQSQELIAEIYKRGKPVELRLLQRNGAPVCGRFVQSDYCSLLPIFPAIGDETVLWPHGMTQGEFDQLVTQSANRTTDPLLSPFTRTTRLGKGKYGWSALSQAEGFATPMARIAGKLEAVAALQGIDPGLQDQLKAQADAFTADHPFPFVQSDQIWLQNDGELELLLGAYTTDRDQFATKAQFSFVLGRVRPDLTEWVGQVAAQRQAVEEGLAVALSAAGYKARKLDVTPVVRVIDALRTAGATNGDGGPMRVVRSDVPLPQGEGRGAKMLVIANHLEAAVPLLREMASQTMAGAPVEGITPQSVVRRATVREVLSDLGPQQQVTAPALAEAQADAVGQWALKLLVDKGVLTNKEAQTIYVAHITELMAAVYKAVGTGTPATRSAKLQLAALAKAGVLTSKGVQFTLNLPKVRGAYQSLLQKLAKVRSSSEAKAATTLMQRHLDHFAATFGSTLERIRAAALPRDIAVTYEVEG